jgi:hypothetical protein
MQIRRAHTRRDLRLIIVYGCSGRNDSRTCRKLRRCCLLRFIEVVGFRPTILGVVIEGASPRVSLGVI